MMKSVLYGIIISIHAPREGGDPTHPSGDGQNRDISIHAPREGGDFSFCGLVSII